MLTFANDAYRSTLANWMAGMHRLGVDNYEVVCMDRTTASFMASIGRPCSSCAEITGSLHDVWRFRLQVLAELLEKGVDVVFSDVDAIWLQNPFGVLEGGDIVASRGTIPGRVRLKLGATACMGWVFFRGTPAVARFVREEVVPRFNRDDQWALNFALLGGGLSFSPPLTPYKNSTEIAEGKAGTLAVKLLDDRRFPRRCSRGLDGAVVAHCYSPHSSEHKKGTLRTHHLWFLQDTWEKAPHVRNFSAWIRNVSIAGPAP